MNSTRVASLGLGVVVSCLAAFSIFAAYSTQVQVDRVQRSAALQTSYDAAASAIQALRSSQLQYLLDPSPARLAGFVRAAQALVVTIEEIAARGGPADVEVANEVLRYHDPYVASSERLLGMVASGNQAEARRIDQEEADPLFQNMRVRLTAAAQQRKAEAETAALALERTASWMRIAAPVVFAIGFVLLLGLWRVLDQADRAKQRTYRQIEQLSRLRGEFVAIVSHEFRTPLTGIQGFSEMMRDEELTIPEMKEYAGDINRDARRLSRLLNDMLDLDQMEAGLMKPNLTQLDLNNIAVHTAARFEPNPGDHPIELELDEQLPRITGDPDRLGQVISNLVGNAIKYSPNGSPVELRTRRENGAVVLTVRDHGIGIPTDQLTNIFDRYSQTEPSATRTIQGTGLGLPIVRQIVKLHAGKVWATSELGKGSVFHVQLPLPTA